MLCIIIHSHEGNLLLLTEIGEPGVTETRDKLPVTEPENLGVIQGMG